MNSPDNPPGDGAGGPPDPATPVGPTRDLRRSRDNRIATGLAGGLGRYFGVDPVIFRIVFAVLALFGGSGIVLYLIGWLAIPEDGAPNAPLDRVVARMRRHSLPVWIAAAIALLLIWLIGFSWWEPYSFAPAALVILAMFFLLRGRDQRLNAAASGPAPAHPGSPLGTPASADADPAVLDPAAVQLRSWFEQSRTRGRLRRSRSAPVTRIAAGLIIATLAGLVVADVVVGIPFATYFWAVGAITLAALAVGLVARRTPRLLSLLLLPISVALITFGTSPARAHDGFGERTWQPATTADLSAKYRFGFGRSTVDLTRLGTDAPARTIHVVQAAGQMRLLVPAGLAVRVQAHVHQGVASLGGTDLDQGWNVDTVWSSPTASTAGSVLTIDAELTAGQIMIRTTP